MGDDMNYCIELSVSTIIFWAFIFGIMVGVVCYRIATTPRNPAKPIDYYDGTHGMGYRPSPVSKKAPPKPLYNPNK